MYQLRYSGLSSGVSSHSSLSKVCTSSVDCSRFPVSVLISKFEIIISFIFRDESHIDFRSRLWGLSLMTLSKLKNYRISKLINCHELSMAKLSE